MTRPGSAFEAGDLDAAVASAASAAALITGAAAIGQQRLIVGIAVAVGLLLLLLVRRPAAPPPSPATGARPRAATRRCGRLRHPGRARCRRRPPMPRSTSMRPGRALRYTRRRSGRRSPPAVTDSGTGGRAPRAVNRLPMPDVRPAGDCSNGRSPQPPVARDPVGRLGRRLLRARREDPRAGGPRSRRHDGGLHPRRTPSCAASTRRRTCSATSWPEPTRPRRGSRRSTTAT